MNVAEDESLHQEDIMRDTIQIAMNPSVYLTKKLDMKNNQCAPKVQFKRDKSAPTRNNN